MTVRPARTMRLAVFPRLARRLASLDHLSTEYEGTALRSHPGLPQPVWKG